MENAKNIKLHPTELHSEVALCIAYCLGATYDNAERIAKQITKEEIIDCVHLIRCRMYRNLS